MSRPLAVHNSANNQVITGNCEINDGWNEWLLTDWEYLVLPIYQQQFSFQSSPQTKSHLITTIKKRKKHTAYTILNLQLYVGKKNRNVHIQELMLRENFIKYSEKKKNIWSHLMVPHRPAGHPSPPNTLDLHTAEVHGARCRSSLMHQNPTQWSQQNRCIPVTIDLSYWRNDP